MTAPTSSNDLKGFSWPNGARVAVVVTCLMENWSGDKGPPFSVQTTSLKAGTHDRAAMTWGWYGSRNGVWRLLKILNENQAPSTFVANAHSMELAPDAVECMLKSGHEVAAHSYTRPVENGRGRDESDGRHGVEALPMGSKNRVAAEILNRVERMLESAPARTGSRA